MFYYILRRETLGLTSLNHAQQQKTTQNNIVSCIGFKSLSLSEIINVFFFMHSKSWLFLYVDFVSKEVIFYKGSPLQFYKLSTMLYILTYQVGREKFLTLSGSCNKTFWSR